MRVREPLEELHDTQLYKTLAAVSAEFAERIDVFVSKIVPILATTIQHFPYYTRHDANHGFRVLRRIEQLIVPTSFSAGNPYSFGATELFLLIAAAYSHDLGMTVFPGEEGVLPKDLSIPLDSEWKTNPALQVYLRKNHSKRGGDYIALNANDLQVPRNLVGQLDWLMKSHNMSIPELDTNLSAPFAAEEREIDIRQLSIILCIADAIEFSDTRVVDGVLDLISRDPSDSARKSYLENMKHICVGDSLAIDRDGRILVYGSFDDSEVLSLAHHTFDQIEEWIRGYSDIERRSAVRRLRVRPEPLQRRLELRGGRFERLGVRISKKNIIDLISSNAVWKSNAGAVIRELVQNSVEACRYRAFHSSRSDRYEPRITVRFDRKNRTMSVQDNGCGMSERIILNHFLTVGNSRAAEKAYSTEGYAPLARFGIGFWSVFTIADRADIQTLAFEDAIQSLEPKKGISFDVEIRELKDFTVFSDEPMAPGTTVTLHLKPDLVLDELFEQARCQFLCSEIPLEFRIDSDTIAIPSFVPDVLDEDLLGAKQPRKSELEVETFKWRGRRGEIELAFALAFRRTSSRPTFMGMDGAPILSGPDGGIRWPSLAICGFRGNFFNAVGAFCFDLPRVGTFYANCETPRGFEYSIDRQSLLANETQRNTTNAIIDLVHSGYREFLRDTGALNEKDIYELNEESRTGGGNVFDLFTGAQLSEAYSKNPDLLCFKLILVNLVFLPPPNVPESKYLNVTDLAKQVGTAWVIQSSISIPAGGLRNYYIPPETLLPAAYAHAQTRLTKATRDEKMYVIEPNGLASLLFDCDPTSSVEFTSIPGPVDLQIPIQKISLEKVRFVDGPQGILSQVQGRWSGAIYVREFKTPNGRPYVFLGRSRVLVEASSPLRSYLEDLKSQSRLTKMADTIALLKQDESGYYPKELSGLF
jgi:hypothetical protein